MNYQSEIIKKVWASQKIWTFFKYQNLLNNRLKELIEELNPKIQTVIQLKEKKQQIGITNQQFTKVCSKALENQANILKPLYLLNKRNIFNNQTYLIDILQIIHYSTNNEESNYVENIMKNPKQIKEQKQLYKILEFIFVILQNKQQETTKYQILICLDSILKQLMICSQINPEILQNLRQFSKYNRIIAYKKSYQGIGQYIKAITQFDSKIKFDLTSETIEQTLHNILEQLDCVICDIAMNDPVSMKCGHSFCLQCMIQVQNTSKKCPICRVEQLDEILLSENNKFLTKLIQLRLSFDNQTNLQQNFDDYPYQKIDIKPQSSESFHQKLILRTQQSLQQLIEQEVVIDTKRFKSLSTYLFQQILQKYLIFIIIDKNENAYLVKNILTHISQNKTKIRILYQEKIQIVEQYFSKILLKTDNGEYIFESQFATAITFQDQVIDLNNIDIQQQLTNSINNIKGFFNQILVNQQQDQTYQVVYTFLTQVGFWNLQNSDLITNYDQMRQYSYLVPKILKVSQKERVEILSMNNLIRRLDLIEKSLNRFKKCSNILVIFEFQRQNNNSQKDSIIFTLVLLFLLFFLWL